MKAVRIHEFGKSDVLRYEEISKPRPADDEVLIRVRAASVNPVDWKIREGSLQAFLPLQLPITLGCDLAGTIEEVGSKVKTLKAGDQIFGYVSLTRNGAYAEYAIAKESEVAPKPKTLDFVQAAAVPVGALTSWQALFDSAQLSAGQKILVHAASGGVGAFAVQLAKAKGAFVIGTASGKNEEFVRKLGADEFVDYVTTRFEDVVKDVDVVFDTIGGETQARSFAVLKRGGVLVSIVEPPSPQDCAKYDVKGTMIGVQPDAEQLRKISELIDAGKIAVNVETVLPLNEIKQAHELSASGRTRGKIVLQIG
jgi:NADPH:quinone reductase-like Zn-dependent oxidoreductase